MQPVVFLALINKSQNCLNNKKNIVQSFMSLAIIRMTYMYVMENAKH